MLMTKLRTLAIAAALGTALATPQFASAQAPSPEPRPAGQPNAGDVRSLPDARPGPNVQPVPTAPYTTGTQRDVTPRADRAPDTRTTRGDRWYSRWFSRDSMARTPGQQLAPHVLGSRKSAMTAPIRARSTTRRTSN